MKMDALVKKYPEKGLWLESVDVPKTPLNHALIKIRKTAICGTDVHIYNWDDWSQKTIKTPMIIGHEFVGEIAEINAAPESSLGYKVGDLVSGEGHVVCGRCHNCMAGVRHLCPNTVGIGVNSSGIFAQYAAIPLSNLYKCEKNIAEEIYAIFDPLGNAIHTALSFDLFGQDVLITGAGPIGIMAAAIAKHAGAKNVVLTNTSDWRLDFANEVVKGIRTINTKKQDLREFARDLGIVEGFNVGLEVSGSASAFNSMINNMINGGKIAVLGLQQSDTFIDWNKVIFGSLTIKGIYGREMFRSWQQMSAMLSSGLDLSKIITHRLNYKDFEQGFELMNSKKCGKIILEWNK